MTDQRGEIVFTDLEKNRVYSLRQTAAPENYKYDYKETEIYVDENGRIDEEASAELDFTNYISRINIEVRGMLLSGPVSNVSLALYNGNDELIRVWTSSGSAETFENLPRGGYYVVLNGDDKKRYEFEFVEDAALQEVSVAIWTFQDIAAVAAAAAIVLGGILGVAGILRRRRKAVKRGAGKEADREE